METNQKGNFKLTKLSHMQKMSREMEPKSKKSKKSGNSKSIRSQLKVDGPKTEFKRSLCENYTMFSLYLNRIVYSVDLFEGSSMIESIRSTNVQGGTVHFAKRTVYLPKGPSIFR